MYQCGDKVLYGVHGICEIIAVEPRKIEKKVIEYYVLEPIEQHGTRYYVPKNNKCALSKLKPMLTLEELKTILSKVKSHEIAWISDEGQRKQRYKDLITSGDRVALIEMIHALHKHKQQQATAGRKFHLCDENFLRDAEKLLTVEISLVLDLPQSEVADYIIDILTVN